MIAVMGYSAIATLLIVAVVHVLFGLRVDEEAETTGLDIGQHGERIGT